MPTHWCANFDFGDVLDHGLSRNAWLMQYQYEHGGFDYQGNRRQKARTTGTWKSLTDLAIGDWILAYLAGSTFFAIGEVCSPRKLVDPMKGNLHVDTVSRTVADSCHLHFDGIVRYSDAPAFYEDFTDDWSLPTDKFKGNAPPTYPYAQRIDVVQWRHVVRDGVEVPGLATVAPLPEYRKPIFQIDADFFADVAAELRAASVKT